MSQNQLRGDKKDLQYRKTGVIGGVGQNNSSDYQQRPLSGGSGTAPSLSSNAPASRSCKKPNNAQGGQSRGHAVSVNSSSDPNPAAGVRPVENGSHVQSTVSAVSHKPALAAIPKSVDASSPKSNQPVPKSPSSQTSSMTSDPAFPATPSKGDAGKGFSLQFGSISPGFVSDMQVPARTSSAPPNVDEQQRNQSLRTTSRASPAHPVLSAPKQLMSKLDGSAEKPTPHEPRSGTKVTRKVPITSTPHPPIQAQMPTGPPVPPISIPMQYTQPTGPMQFGGPNPPILPQGMRPNSHQMPMQMAFGGPNTQIPSQVQRPVFMTGLHHHLMQNQGIIHQGLSFGFNPQMVHQPGNLGLNTPPQLNQQAAKINSARKTIKITHPDTHEELKLDDKKDGSPGSQVTHITHPQSHPIPPYTGAPGGFYPNSYTSSSPFTPQPNSLPMTSTSLAPRFNYSMPGLPEPSNLESAWSTPQIRSLAPSPLVSTPTTVKPAGNANSTSVNLKVNPDSSSPPLKSRFESAKQAGIFVPTSPNANVNKETVAELDSLKGTQEQSGQKGHLQRTSQGHGELFTVATSESTVKCTPSVPGSKEGGLDEVHNSSESFVAPLSAMSASGNGIEDKLTNSQAVKEKDSHLLSVTKHENETDYSKGLQSDNPLKAMDVKKSDHATGLLATSQAEKTTANNAGIDKAPHSENLSETNMDSEVEIIENARPSSSSSIVSGSSRLSGEPSKNKNNKGKKKRKEMFQKAETLGTNPDLYMAYKNSNECKETVVTEESVLDHNTKEVPGSRLENGLVKKLDEQNKPELENWEDVADGSTPKLEMSGNVKGRDFHQDDDVGLVKRYSRDFLLTISEQCTDLPEGFQMTPDIDDILVRLNLNDSRDFSGNGRVNDRSTGAARHDRRFNGSMDGNRWSKPNPNLSNRDLGVDLPYASNMTGSRSGPVVRPRGQGPVQHGGGILPGIMHSMSFQGTHRNNHEADRWQRSTSFNKGATPSPQTPQQVMHKAEKKYEVGKVSDGEQAKQRRLKAILNKLTPQNFEKLFEQVKEVNIDNVVTLTGVISQIFDKALMEPTFCEMYANFCQHLASELPDLSVDNQKITFRRLLLNKCQEEFERGEREEEEVNKDEQSDQEREEKRLKVRRRMLGNIRLIGELYKKRMLTERIMHECIKKLLGNYQDADEEDIEALCKLMSTIGEMIDHPKAKEHMDAYFDIMRQLSNDMKLSSRVRFMLKDTIDLRRNRWQQRRKVEGPKKIEEVHRAAAQERLGQTSRLTRGSSMSSSARRGMGPPLEYAPRGSVMSSPGGYRGVGQQSRGLLGQDARLDDQGEFENQTPSAPLLQHPSGDGPIMLGPKGGLARGMSIKGQTSSPAADNSSSHGDSRRGVGGLNGFSNLSDRGGYNSQGDPKHEVPVASEQPTSQELSTNATQKLSVEKVYPEERLREMSMAAIKEYYSAKDDKEAELCIKGLNAPSFYPTVVSMWVTDALERKDTERTVLTKLFVSLTKAQEGTFNTSHLIQGFESVLTNFEDVVTDAPRAPEYLGRMFGTLVLENVLPLQDVCKLIHQGGEEPGRLLEIGLAGDVLGSILETIKSEKGDATLNELRTRSKLRLEDFLPPEPLKSRKLMMFL